MSLSVGAELGATADRRGADTGALRKRLQRWYTNDDVKRACARKMASYSEVLRPPMCRRDILERMRGKIKPAINYRRIQLRGKIHLCQRLVQPLVCFTAQRHN